MSERNRENERRVEGTSMFSDLGFVDKIKYAFGCLARIKKY